MSRRAVIHSPQNAHTKPVAVHCRRVEWGAVALILLGVAFLLGGVALSAAQHAGR